MSLRPLARNRLTRQLLWLAATKRARSAIRWITPYLEPHETILDVGAGSCSIALMLSKAGHRVTPLDIIDLSWTSDMRPTLYDGRTMPFRDQNFDVALIFTVLHHTPQPESILQEARRVAKKIIVVEDVYTNQAHKLATFFIDSLLNLEFIGHPHTNKTDEQWRALFKKLDLKLIASKAATSYLVLRHRLYVLKPEPISNLPSVK